MVYRSKYGKFRCAREKVERVISAPIIAILRSPRISPVSKTPRIPSHETGIK